jgi:hypothetical protein
MLSSHQRVILPRGIFPCSSPTKDVYASAFPHACYMSYPSYPPRLHHYNYTLLRILVSKLLAVQILVNRKGEASQHLVHLNSEATDLFGIVYTFQFTPYRKHTASRL